MFSSQVATNTKLVRLLESLFSESLRFLFVYDSFTSLCKSTHNSLLASSPRVWPLEPRGGLGPADATRRLSDGVTGAAGGRPGQATTFFRGRACFFPSRLPLRVLGPAPGLGPTRPEAGACTRPRELAARPTGTTLRPARTTGRAGVAGDTEGR